MLSSPMRSFLSLLPLYFLLSCQNAVDIEKEKELIQKQIDLIAKAHFDKDAAQFYAPYASSWYDAREGRIGKRNKDSVLAGTQEYLDRMEFLGLETTHEPIIEISEDGKMASFMGAVVLKGKYDSEPVFWVVSWQSVLKKINDEWKIISNANTQATAESTSKVVLEMAIKEIGQLKKESTIYALANCKSPDGSFKTLLISDRSGARMEQQQEEYHAIFKYGPSSSWSYELPSGKLNEKLDGPTEMFVRGHELHWLSFRPEDRFSNSTFTGFEEYSGQTAFKIKFSDSLNRPVYFYYAFENYLPLGFSIVAGPDDNRINVYYSNWQALGNLKVFYNATFAEGSSLFEYAYSDLRISDDKDYDLDSKSAYIE